MRFAIAFGVRKSFLPIVESNESDELGFFGDWNLGISKNSEGEIQRAETRGLVEVSRRIDLMDDSLMGLYNM